MKDTKFSILITKNILSLDYSTLINTCSSTDYLKLNERTGINKIFSTQSREFCLIFQLLASLRCKGKSTRQTGNLNQSPNSAINQLCVPPRPKGSWLTGNSNIRQVFLEGHSTTKKEAAGDPNESNGSPLRFLIPSRLGKTGTKIIIWQNFSEESERRCCPIYSNKTNSPGQCGSDGWSIIQYTRR